MTVAGEVRKAAYFDSVTLMRLAKELTARPGVLEAAAVMGTRSNKALLAASGLLVPAFRNARETDLLIAVRGRTASAARNALAAAGDILRGLSRPSTGAAQGKPRGLEEALKALRGANLALISVAGRYAGREAMRALEHGLHVMIFSDNVPLEEEIRLKRYAAPRGLFVMGPDCGTAIVNGVPLGFANAVRRGPVGVVAAAGTGLQEVACHISNLGSGISQALGTGGRDVKREVGGWMMRQGLRALAEDEATKVIVLVSKPPDRPVLRQIQAALRRVRKPVVTLFLGAPARAGAPATLEEAAHVAVALARGRDPREALEALAARDRGIARQAARLAARCRRGRKYVRGLFSGGTFCAEAQVILGRRLARVYSNVPTGKVRRLKSSTRSVGHTLIDLGEDEFTQGRLHPMMDFGLRTRRLAQEARDPKTAVILFDVVLGYGAHPAPADELAPVVREAARKVCVVCSVTGTPRDPQGFARVQRALRKAGAHVMPSNAAACLLAAEIARRLSTGRRGRER